MAAKRLPTRWQAFKAWPLGAKALAVLATLLVLQPLSLILGRGLTSFGVTFPLTVGLLLWAWLCFRQPITAWLQAKRWRRILGRLFLLGVGLWLISLLVFFISLAQAAHEPDEVQGPVAAIIVLGSSTPNAQPSPALQARLDAAHIVAHRFPHAVVAVSGGVDFGETVSEGQVMGDYLRGQGLDPHRIVQEEASTSTDLNLKLSQPILAQRGVVLADPIVVVTSDFHVWRAERIAQRQDWQQVQMVGAPMPLTIRYNAWLREYFAVASSWLLGEM